jgi:uridine phosphorylase
VNREAWYLRCRSEDVGDRAILVGDPGRVDLVASRLEDVRWLNAERGLTTATGARDGHRVTVSAFGMGAPIAAVVLDELHQLGVRTFLRLGTVMCLEPAELGDLVLADAAVRNEATSAAYVPDGYPAAADHELAAALRQAAESAGAALRAGLVDSSDAFYPSMLHASERHEQLLRLGVLALDMETSAVLAIGRALGARAASLCVATVDARTSRKLSAPERVAAEELLVNVGLEALLGVSAPEAEGIRL